MKSRIPDTGQEEKSGRKIMIRKSSISLLTLVALVPAVNIVCRAQSLSPLTRHVRNVVLNGQAKSVGRLPAAQPMRLVLVLPHRNQAALDNFLKEIYDPSSASYRQFLTVAEFTNRFGPSQEDYDAVVSFAETHGFTVVGTSTNRMNVDVTGPVASIEEAFHLTMGIYQHPTESRTFYAPDREPTPDLAVPLWHIAGLDNYSIPRPALVRRPPGVQPAATTGSCPSSSFCGSDMRAAYYGGTALTGSGQSLGLLEYYGTDLADLTTYFKNAGQTNKVPITLLSTDGTTTSCLESAGCDDTEQTLDMTQAIGMAPGLASLVMYVGSTDSAIFNAMATASPLNAQLSSSWTWSPADPNTDNPYFEEFAAQGQNLFQAAGDDDAWKSSSEIFPADDVYLTSVGGTDLETSSAGGAWSSETAWADSGGGISPDKYAIPSWQTATAAGCSSCSKTYRNGPDVSANANFTFYVCADQTTCTANEYGGTSFAAPMWAGYLALANQQAVANGGKTLGFINPTLYTVGLGSSYHTDFHDITSGSNGYSATAGYDLATGWGSPNGSSLINSLTGSSPTPGFSLSASPASVSVAQGSSGTSTITSTVTGGFDSAISLTASGQPTGVTIGFNPTSITGAGNSTMMMTVASSAATGTYSITVTGTSGSTVETTTVSLTVTTVASPSFSISASPTSVSVLEGSNGTSTISTTVSGGFDSAIALTASGQPTGVTVSFNPTSIAAPGSGASTMTMAVATTTASGTYTITVTGTGGGITHTATVSLTVTAATKGAFTISVSPPAGYLYQGQSGYAVITTTVSGGFDSAIALTASGQPTGVTVSFSPASIAAPGSGTSDMLLSVARNAPTGTYPITITGTGGGITHTTVLTFEVVPR
jgi:subtilase family serine protease